MQQPQEKPADDHILASPTWLLIVRILQSLLSLIILALAAALMHDAYLDEEGLALAIGLITWLAVKYIILSERLSVLRPFYNIIAILVIDGVLVILWLATFAAVAARRASFKFNVRVDGCFDDGSLFNSKTCFTKRQLMKRGVILFKSGQGMLSAIAGLGALVWLLFIASFAYTLWSFLQARKQGRFQFGGPQVTNQSFQMEPKVEQQYQQEQQLMQQQSGGPYQPQAETQYHPQPTEQYPVPYAPPQPAAYAPEQAAYGGGQYPVQQQQQYQPPYQGSPPPAAVSPP
ncbi:hypothetical protein PT974_05838 [Cladobotryum mycophilum]|uniref:MARVEL domain-containing protein n=1 Tax=Cladobotryum mycophilum TaxID=491253 RepID=A0ABR0SK51_9HYPO